MCIRDRNSEVGFCRKVLQVFEENGISIEHMPSGIDTMSVFVHQDELKEMEQKVIAGIPGRWSLTCWSWSLTWRWLQW